MGSPSQSVNPRQSATFRTLPEVRPYPTRNENYPDLQAQESGRLTSPRMSRDIALNIYLKGAHADGVINMFSCITMYCLVSGGQPATFFEASARTRSRSAASRYAHT